MIRFTRFCSYALRVASIGLLALGLSGCATTETSAPPSTITSTRPRGDATSDLLRVGDLVTISFSGVADPPTLRHEERIKDDGHITLPFIGAIEAAGKTRAELQQTILASYVPQYYRHLTVTIGSENRFFYVEGMVKNPGRYSFAGEMSVLRCIAAAGDFNDFAKRSKVEVTRATGKKEHIDCLEAQTHPGKDLPIFPDDRIYVPRRLF